MSKFLTMEDLANRIENERPDILDAIEETEIEHKLAKTLIRRRKALRLSQQQLTKRAHLTQCQISRLEKGEIKNFSTLKSALNALDLEILIVPKRTIKTNDPVSRSRRKYKIYKKNKI